MNCIAPSISKSKIANFILKNEKMADSIAKMHPLKRVGEGIGQLGEFALLELKLKNGDDLNLFLKIQTDTEDMDNVAKDYQFYIREVKY